MASKIARFTSQFVNEDVDKLKEQALVSARWQKEYFSALRYGVDYTRFSLGNREEIPYRRFDCDNVWMIRGAEHMESDLVNFVEGVRAGKMGYLTAATGLGKSTTLLKRVVTMVGCKAVSIQPKDKFAKSVLDYMLTMVSKQGDDPVVSFQYLKKHAELTLGDLTYMSAAVFLILLLVYPEWLDHNGVGLIYVDEAHFDSDEYDILRCLTMVGAFGRRTVCFATATPPMGVSCEMYRKVRFTKEVFPVMEPSVKLRDALPKTPIAGDKLKGSVLVFAIDNGHAKALHEYYKSCDLDVVLHTTDNYTTEWFEVQKKFVGRPVGTRVLVTTTLFDYSVNLWIDVVVNFKVASVLVSSGPGEPIARKLRPVSDATNVQREGRAGRMGTVAKVYEMADLPSKSDTDTTAQDIRRYCWFQLFNIKSNSEGYKTAAMLVGDVSERKLWNILSAGMHPLLLMKYMTSMGLVKEVFKDGLRLYFPDGYRFEVDTSESYDEATAEFAKYVKISTGQMYRIPLSEHNYFLDDMIYVDHIARKKSEPVEAPPSVYFEESTVKKHVRMSEACLPMGLHDKLRMATLDEDDSEATCEIDREETKATLEGYPEYYSPQSPSHGVRGYSMFSRVPEAVLRGGLAPRVVEEVGEKSLPEIPLQNGFACSSLSHRNSMEVMAPTRSVGYGDSRLTQREVVSGRQVQALGGSGKDFGQLSNRHRGDEVQRGFVASGLNERFVPPVFHPSYPRLHYRQNSAPVVPTYVRPVTPTYAECYVPVDIESCEDKLVFPFSNASAHPERFSRPDSVEKDIVYDMMSGRIRISELSKRSREKNFQALIRVWNVTVVDNLQFEGRSERSGVGAYSSRSRRGTRFSVDRLVVLFNTFKTYGLTVCVEDERLPVKGHVMTVDKLRETLVKYQLSKVLMSKDPSVVVDWKNATVSAGVLGAKEVAGACTSLVEESVLDCVVGVHMPRLRQVSLLGQCIGYAYDYDGAVITMGHVIGRETPKNDLVRLTPKASLESDGREPVGVVSLRVPEVDEWLFIVVGFPSAVPSFVVTYGGLRFGMVGPLKVKRIDKSRRVCWCKGYSKSGLSGSPVVSSVNGNLVGLLWGESSENKDIAVSLL